MRGISPDGEPEHDVAAPPPRGAQRLLRVRPADRVHHDVGATAGELLGPDLEVLGGVVDAGDRAVLTTQIELGGGRCRRDHRARP